MLGSQIPSLLEDAFCDKIKLDAFLQRGFLI